ncbi:hypothetical protein TR75_11665 [Hydrogenibacillus schlegelii]|nr:hypothetical protein TR75_11665 [Hydrogenibacillus schlegelii]
MPAIDGNLGAGQRGGEGSMFGLKAEALMQLFFGLGAVMLAARALGALAERIYVPRVIGEVAAGYALGPSVLGTLWPAAYGLIWPEDGKALLWVVAVLGLYFLMLETGLHFHRPEAIARTPLFGRLIVGTTVPALVLAYALVPFFAFSRHAGEAAVGSLGAASFRLIVGVMTSITAVPILAKIFKDLNIDRTPFAQLVITVAAFHDLLLWGLLSVALALAAGTSFGAGDALGTGALFIARTLAVMAAAGGLAWLFFRPVAAVFRRRTAGGGWALPLVLGALFLGAGLATRYDVEAIFVPLFVGLLARLWLKDEERQAVEAGLGQLPLQMFAPLYFAAVGYHVSFGETFSFALLLEFALFAYLLQGLPTYAVARMTGQGRFCALNFAVAFSERGIPGTVVASTAYARGLIDAPLYTVFVVFALGSAAAAGVWFRAVRRGRRPLMAEAAPVLSGDGPRGL